MLLDHYLLYVVSNIFGLYVIKLVDLIGQIQDNLYLRIDTPVAMIIGLRERKCINCTSFNTKPFVYDHTIFFQFDLLQLLHL